MGECVHRDQMQHGGFSCGTSSWFWRSNKQFSVLRNFGIAAPWLVVHCGCPLP